MLDGATLPGWPLLMDEATACRFTTQPRRDFRAMVAARVLPPGRVFPPSRQERWHRAELEAVLARLWGLDGLAPAQQDADAKQAARDALNAFDPEPPRRAAGARPGRQQA